MIEIVVLTSSRGGSASVILEELIRSEKIKVKAVVLNEGVVTNRKKHLIKKIGKTFEIGLFGALNGIKMRKWYTSGVLEYLKVNPLEGICQSNHIPFNITKSINSPQTVEYFETAKADLGLSLGNGYIGRKVFSVPKFGMINVHHEELPAYQNAQSIIWQIFNNSRHTAFTIHKIDQHIDTGDVLYKEMMPITLKESLGATVSFNYAELLKKSAEGLRRVLDDFEAHFENSSPQGKGGSYTTPSLLQYLRILKNFKKMKSNVPAEAK